MRTTCTLLLSLLALGAFAVEVRAQAAQPKDPVAVRASWDVKGWGRTRDEAIQYALEKAREEVQKYLQREVPQFAWTPDVEYIGKWLPRGEPRRLPAEDPQIETRGIKQQMQCWVVPVAITGERHVDLVREARLQHTRIEKARRDVRAEERLGTAGKYLGIVVAL